MTKIIVKHDFQRLNLLLRGLGDKKTIQQATARAITRTLPTVQRAAFNSFRSKKIAKLNSAQIKMRFRAYKLVGAGQPVENQYGKIWITPAKESLGHFFAKKVRAGRSEVVAKQDQFGGWRGIQLYSVKLNQYGAPYLRDPRRAFLVQKPAGPVVFGRDQGSKRLPITKLWGPAFTQLAEETGVVDTVATVARVKFQYNFEHEAKFYAERAIARARGSK